MERQNQNSKLKLHYFKHKQGPWYGQIAINNLAQLIYKVQKSVLKYFYTINIQYFLGKYLVKFNTWSLRHNCEKHFWDETSKVGYIRKHFSFLYMWGRKWHHGRRKKKYYYSICMSPTTKSDICMPNNLVNLISF